MSQSDNTLLIQRLRKLSQMTTQNGCSENEARTAMAMLQRLMAEHQLSMDDLQVREAARNCIKDSFNSFGSHRPEWAQCATSVAKYCGVKVWSSREYGDPLGLGLGSEHFTSINYFGLEVDVCAAIQLSLIISNAVTTEAALWAKRERTRDKTLLTSFVVGMCDRLSERLREMATPTAASTGTELIVLKGKLVTEEFAKLNLRLRVNNWRGTPVNAGAYTAGKSAGNNVGLHKGASFGSAQRTIGHKS